MILPNVLNRPLPPLPSMMLLDGAPQRLSTADYFRSWEPLPETGSLAFPRLLDIGGSEFRQDRIYPTRPTDNVLCLLRSSWALMASAARRWREKSDTDAVPGSSHVILQRFTPAEADFSGAWRFDDGLAGSQRLGKVSMQDADGRVLEVRQDSPHSDLIVTAGWRVDGQAAIVRQETRIGKRGAMTVGYAFAFRDPFLEGLREALELDKRAGAERLVMRLAALIQNCGQYAAYAPDPVVFERSDEMCRVGFLRNPGASVECRRLSFPRGRELTIRLASPPMSRGSFPLHPPLLEKLWNPVYARALMSGFENPPMA